MLGIVRLCKALRYRFHLLLINPKLRKNRIEFLSELTGSDYDTCKLYIEEIEKDKEFLRAVTGLLKKYTRYYIPSRFDFMASETGGSVFFHSVSLYAFVRLIQPKVIVETGGTPGKSSAFILRALERNGGVSFTRSICHHRNQSRIK